MNNNLPLLIFIVPFMSFDIDGWIILLISGMAYVFSGGWL